MDVLLKSQADQLDEFALAVGEIVLGGANLVMTLDDPDVVWYVESGSLDVFAVESRESNQMQLASRHRHVARLEPGQMAFGIDSDGHNENDLWLIAKGTAGSILRRVYLHQILDRELTSEWSSRVDLWVARLARAVTRDIPSKPIVGKRLSQPEDLELDAGNLIAAQSEVIWIRPSTESPMEGNPATYLDTEAVGGENGIATVPLTSSTWLTAERQVTLHTFTSGQLADTNSLAPALADFNRLILRVELLNRTFLTADAAIEAVEWDEHQRVFENRVRSGLFGLLKSGVSGGMLRNSTAGSTETSSALTLALEQIGAWEGIPFRVPHMLERVTGGEFSLQDFLQASGIFARQVTLPTNSRWWLSDASALLCFLQEDNQPVALLPAKLGGYQIVYPDGKHQRLSRTGAQSLNPIAWCFHPRLPDKRPKIGDLIRLSVSKPLPDVSRLLLLGILVGLAMLAPSIVMGIVADQTIPVASTSSLIQWTLLLAGVGVVGALLRAMQGSTLLKLEARAALRLDIAVLHRLFKLPSSFTRRFTSGDLVTRATTFRVLRDRISGVVVQSLLSVIFLLPAFGLLFLYSPRVGWVSLAIGVVVLIVGGVLAMKQLGPQRSKYEASRRVASVIHQFIGAVTKLRTSGAQKTAFAIWARRFQEQQQAHLDIGIYDDHLVALSAALPTFVGGSLFWIATQSNFDGAATFLTLYLASMVFYAAVTRLGESFAALVTILPGVEQVKPLLVHETDDGATGETVNLRGGISLDNISFRYDEDAPFILNDVSIRAEPGEFVAIVGGSGAGKSTLVRLALGLSQPSSGTVTYDGLDLNRLGFAAIRSQIGVVMQDGNLLEGSVVSAILGFSNNQGLDDAWQAARLAAIEEDIRGMPMGMHTRIGENGATLSGGQVQRIQLAAALVRNPRVLFLDEATNWLDNRRQTQVIANLEHLNMTRVVIAHRLSTIRRANRIYVLEQGRVIQEGTFEDLNSVAGAFQEMVRRQTA